MLSTRRVSNLHFWPPPKNHVLDPRGGVQLTFFYPPLQKCKLHFLAPRVNRGLRGWGSKYVKIIQWVNKRNELWSTFRLARRLQSESTVLPSRSLVNIWPCSSKYCLKISFHRHPQAIFNSSIQPGWTRCSDASEDRENRICNSIRYKHTCATTHLPENIGNDLSWQVCCASLITKKHKHEDRHGPAKTLRQFARTFDGSLHNWVWICLRTQQASTSSVGTNGRCVETVEFWIQISFSGSILFPAWQSIKYGNHVLFDWAAERHVPVLGCHIACRHAGMVCINLPCQKSISFFSSACHSLAQIMQRPAPIRIPGVGICVWRQRLANHPEADQKLRQHPAEWNIRITES